MRRTIRKAEKSKLIKYIFHRYSNNKWNEITITEIAICAQLARRTFYRNFETKEDVLNMYIQKLCCKYKKLLAQEKILTVYNIAKVYFTFWNKNIEFLKLMEKNNLLYMILQKYNEYLPIIHEEFLGNNEEHQDKHMIGYMLAFSAGGFWNTLVKWVHDGTEKTPGEMASIVNKIMDEPILK